MTLIIAYLLMAIVNAHWIWYPIVFVIWLIHVFAGYFTVTEKRSNRIRF